MEYTDEKILNIKYNPKKNLIEIGQAHKWEWVKKNKIFLGICRNNYTCYNDRIFIISKVYSAM